MSCSLYFITKTKFLTIDHERTSIVSPRKKPKTTDPFFGKQKKSTSDKNNTMQYDFLSVNEIPKKIFGPS